MTNGDETVIPRKGKHVVLTSGPSGCGKTHYIRELCARMLREDLTYAVCSADDAFMVDGEYVWDPEKINTAHADCLSKFTNSLIEGVPYVCVDNTNIHLWEIQRYIDIAVLAGYSIDVRIWNEFSREVIHMMSERTTHGTPESTILRMSYEHEIVEIEDYLEAKSRAGHTATATHMTIVDY